MDSYSISRILAMCLSSEYGMFLGGAIITIGIFVLVSKFFDGGSRYFDTKTPSILICSILNGVSVIIVGKLFLEFLAVLPLVLVPVFLAIELYVFYKDSRPKTPMFLGFCVAIHFVVYYDISSALLQIWYTLDSDAFALASLEHRNLQFVLACIFCTLNFLFLHKTRFFPNKEFNRILHVDEAGSVLSALVLPGSFILIITHVLLVPISSSHTVAKSISVMLFVNSAIKSLFILISCYTVILVQATLEKRKGEIKNLSDKLEEESAFRETVQKNAIYYYQLNTRTNVMKDSNNLLSESVYTPGDLHHDFVERILVDAIHPSYRDRIHELATLEFLSGQEGPAMINERIQMSPQYLLKMLNTDGKNEALRKRLAFYKKDYIWVEIATTTTQDSKTGDTILYITVSDIDDKVDLELNLIQAANTDGLTGLFNRKAANGMIENRIEKNEPGTIIIIDLDHFKDINDLMGHPRGDKVLVDAAEKLKSFFSDEDIICRLGGDEFLVFAGNLDNPSLIKRMLDRLNEVLRESIKDPETGKTVHLSASIGVARFPEDANKIDLLYECADNALYKSKENGRDRYTLYMEL